MNTLLSSRLAPHGFEALGMVWDWTYPVCAVYKIYFLDLGKGQELCFDKSTIDRTDHLLTDLTFNVCRVQEDHTSGHDHQSTNDLVNVVMFDKDLMKLWSHGNIFAPLFSSSRGSRQ